MLLVLAARTRGARVENVCQTFFLIFSLTMYFL